MISECLQRHERAEAVAVNCNRRAKHLRQADPRPEQGMNVDIIFGLGALCNDGHLSRRKVDRHGYTKSRAGHRFGGGNLPWG